MGQSREDLLAALDAGWWRFAERLDRVPPAAYSTPTTSGWTVGAMLAHVAAWHEATAYRLRRYRATGRPQPKVEEDDDAFNGRVASEADGVDPEIIRADVRGSYERLREALQALDPALDDEGWVTAVVAGNTFEHYEEHVAELPGGPASEGR